MKERSILCSGPEVRAILAGTKTQARRVVKPQPELLAGGKVFRWNNGNSFGSPAGFALDQSPYGQPGERLWVKETWKPCFDDGSGTAYRASRQPGSPEDKGPWKPSTTMPRNRSRINLALAAVRVESLHDISEADAMAEGCCGITSTCFGSPNFRWLWESINGPGSWEKNPLVWVLDFKEGRP